MLGTALLLISLAWAEGDLRVAERLLADGRFQAALESLQQLPDRTVKWHLLASNAFEGLNDPARAVTEAEAALAIEPRNEAAHLRLGEIFLSHNTPLAAFEVFDEAQQIFPSSFLVTLGKGLALKELQKYEEAAAEFRKCLAQNSASGIAFDGLASSLLHGLNYEGLMETAESYKARNPRDFRGYYYQAAARDGLRLPDDATQRLLEESLQISSSFAASHALFGKVLLRQGDTKRAIVELEKATALRPDHVASHLNLAKAYREVGREGDATREFQIVRELNEKSREPQTSLRYHRGPR